MPIPNYYNNIAFLLWQAWITSGSAIIMSVASIACLIGMPLNIAIIVVLSKVHEIGKSVRVYYITLAFCDFMVLFWYHCLNITIEGFLNWVFGLGINVVSTNPMSCKADRVFWYGSEWVCSWTFVVLCVEKVVAITNPLGSRGKFTQKRAIMAVSGLTASAIPVCITVALTFSAWLPFGNPPWHCTTTVQYPSLSLAVRILIAIGLYRCQTVFVWH